jgi:hypothetical protein
MGQRPAEQLLATDITAFAESSGVASVANRTTIAESSDPAESAIAESLPARNDIAAESIAAGDCWCPTGHRNDISSYYWNNSWFSSSAASSSAYSDDAADFRDTTADARSRGDGIWRRPKK